MHDPVFNWSDISPYNYSLLLDWNKSSVNFLFLEDPPGNLTKAEDNSVLVRSIIVGAILGCVDVFAAIGNLLVIASVATNKRLRTITNYYVMSLAVADLLVSCLVMPLSIVVELTGVWSFGQAVCDMWVSCDVLLCTASILNLCCISLDRYFAITKPLAYSTKRSKRLALSMIGVVWLAAFIITFPPLLGWRETERWTDGTSECRLTSDPGYIVYSALGSFYLPLLVMIFVYLKIFRVASIREKRLRPYRRSFIGKRHQSRCASIHRRNLAINAANRYALKSSGDSEDTDNQAETSLIQADRQCELLSCNNPRHIHEGLVLTSGMAMQDISRPHRISNHNTSSHYFCPLQNNLHQISHQTSPTHRSSVINNGSQGTMYKNGHTFNSLHNTPTMKRISPPLKHQDRYPLRSGSRGINRTDVAISRKDDNRKDTKRRERAMLMRERKAAKTLAIVVGGFIACWLPFFIMYLVEPFCTHCYIPPQLAVFFTWLGYFNSVLNPFIYAFYNRDFRYSFWRLTFGHCSRRSRGSSFTNKQSYAFSAVSEP